MTKGEKIGLAVGVAGVVVAVMAILATYQIAIRQGTFEKSEVELGFDNVDFVGNEQVQMFVGVSKALASNNSVVIPIEFKIKNSGDKVLDDVLLSFAYDKRSGRASSGFDQFIDHHGAVISENLSHDSSSSSEMDYSNFKFKKLNVGQGLSVGDGVYAYASGEQSLVPALSTLGADVTATFEANDITRKTINFNYKVVAVDDDNGLIYWYKNYYAKFYAMEKRDGVSFFAYLERLTFGGGEVTAFLVHPQYAEVSLDGKSVWLPTKDYKSLQKVVFDPYKWSLLFN